MKSATLVGLVLAVTSLLLPRMAAQQGGIPRAAVKESGQTSGRGETPAEQTANGSSGTVEQEIKTLETQRIEAILKGDTSFVEKYFADDCSAIHGNGTLSTKAQEIESFKTGATKYESIEEHELQIRIYGDTAVSNARSSIKATFNGKPYVGDVRNTRVWVKQKGTWKLVAFQATRVASASQ